MLDERFLTEWAVRLRAAAGPATVAVLLRGSHARRAATPFSDIDFDVLVGGGPIQQHPAHLVELADRLLHVSVTVRDVNSWRSHLAEPADWAYGLAVAAPVRLLWVADEQWRSRILPTAAGPGSPGGCEPAPGVGPGQPPAAAAGEAGEAPAGPARRGEGPGARSAGRRRAAPGPGVEAGCAETGLPLIRHPPAVPALEEFVADLGKVAAAYSTNDEIGLRAAAGDLSRHCPTVLRPINPPVTVSARRAALEAVLAFPVAPAGYRSDMLVCAGFLARRPERIYSAACRLVSGVVALVAPYGEIFAPMVGPDFAAALVDGRLARYVDQLGSAEPVARLGRRTTGLGLR